ncbi:UNVERIFIED_CONTAM: hypothetical protein Cloal_1247 [Acetivibrio alkalicellulosi]
MKWFICGSVFIIVIGSMLHFTYDISGKNAIVGVFSAVNESTWEHLKLLFWPAYVFLIIEYLFIGKEYNNYFAGKAVSFIVGMFLIISLFYTYTGILGKNFLIADISIFVISVIISQYIGYRIMSWTFFIGKIGNIGSLIAIMLLVVLFISFTFNPPNIPLFKDPVKGGYTILLKKFAF